MTEFYENVELPASFGGVDAVFRAAKGSLSKNKIKKKFESVDAYTLHKPLRKNFRRNRVIVYSVDQQWQADLVDMTHLQRHNNGYRYILTCIDILSKYAWGIPLKEKTGNAIVTAFQKIFQERKPQSLQTDRGTEFTNRKFQTFLKDNNVRFFTTFNTTKASVCERLNRTIKTKMWKYFTSKNTFKYIDVMDGIMKSYNATYHSSIKRAPNEVNKENERDVWFALYGELEYLKKTPCQLKEGDVVRVSKAKLTFEKGYESNWTEEIFVVTKCEQRLQLPVYRIKDLLGEPIQGTFYIEELQKVQPKELFPIEKILDKRFRKKRLEYLIKYKGYPPKFNQWLPSTNLFSL